MTDFGNVIGDTSLQRQVVLTGNQFRKGASAPADVTIGTTPTIDALRFSATSQLVSIYEVMPFNWDHGDIDIILVWSLVSTQTNGEQLSTTLDYTATRGRDPDGYGVARASTQVTDNMTVTTAEGLAVGDIYDQTFTLSSTDATNPLIGANAIAMEIHLTNLTGIASADLLAGCINFTATY